MITREWFMARVEVTPECWLWKGDKDSDGYGRVRIDDKRRRTAHRVSYELFVGPMPVGMEPDHLCRNHSCVRPDHLEAVTHRENILRGTSPAALHARQVTCHQGHPLHAAGGRRHCRTCNAEAARRYRQRKKIEA